jgi:Glucanosyltransferase
MLGTRKGLGSKLTDIQGKKPPTMDSLDFLNCGPRDQSIDYYMFAFGSISVQSCHTSNIFKEQKIIESFANYSIPSILGYGCAQERSHNYEEVQLIYGELGSKVLSGGIVYDWLRQDWRNKDMG